MQNTPAMQMMFVWAAYGLTLALTTTIVAQSFFAMRRAEQRAAALRRDRA